MKGPSTKLVNVNGKTVLPGFIESHAHPLQDAAKLLQLDLRAEVTPDIESILHVVCILVKSNHFSVLDCHFSCVRADFIHRVNVGVIKDYICEHFIYLLWMLQWTS